MEVIKLKYSMKPSPAKPRIKIQHRANGGSQTSQLYLLNTRWRTTVGQEGEGGG